MNASPSIRPALTLTLALLAPWPAAAQPPAPATPPAPPAAEAMQPAEAVQAADRALAAAVAAHDPAAFGALVAPDAVFLGSRVSQGRDAVLASWAPFFAAGGPTLAWEPTEAHAAASGDLAYTVGDYTLTLPAAGDAPPTVDRGRYVTVWARGDDGAWQVVADGSLARSRSEAIEAALVGREDPPPGAEWELAWLPADTMIHSAAGDLLLAVGSYELRPAGGDEAPAVLAGTGFQVWSRQDDGAWGTVASSLAPALPAATP